MPSPTIQQPAPQNLADVTQRILALEARPYQFADFNNKDGFYIIEHFMGTQPQTAANYGVIFTARRPTSVLWIGVRYETASGAAATMNVFSVPDGTAKGGGTSILASTFDLNSTPDTLQIKQTTGLNRNNTLAENVSLALVPLGTLTSLAGLTVVIYCSFWNKGQYR